MAYIVYTGKRELITTNLALYSEVFDNAYWTKTNITVTADNTTAPDGNVTADRLVETATTAVHSASASFASLVSSSTYTYSVYAKQGERTWLALFITKKDGTVGSAYFNLATGVLGTATGVTAAIVASSNGFYRCSISASVLTGATTPIFETRLATGDTVSSYLGVITSGLFVWGAQLEKKSTPSEYNQTTTAAAHASGSSYVLSFDVASVDRSTKRTRTAQITLGGNKETIFQRNEVDWSMKTDILQESDLPQWREFWASVSAGETLTFDPYGTYKLGADGLRTLVADTSLSVTTDDDSYQEQREMNTKQYRISLKLRVN